MVQAVLCGPTININVGSNALSALVLFNVGLDALSALVLVKVASGADALSVNVGVGSDALRVWYEMMRLHINTMVTVTFRISRIIL